MDLGVIKNKIEKVISYESRLFVIKDIIKLAYRDFSLGDYENKKKSFVRLHYLKIFLDYTYLKIYQNEIKKLSSNEKLLNYFETVLLANGYDLSK